MVKAIWTWYSSQAVDFGGGDEGLLGLGLMYGSRKPMIQLKFGGFKLALIEPNVVSATNAAGVSSSVNTTGATFADTAVILPKIEASYRYSADKFFFDLGAGFQTYNYTDASDQNSTSLTSWVIGAGGGYNFGNGYVKLQLNYDTNGATYGLSRNAAAAIPGFTVFTTYIDTDGNFADVTRFGGALVIGGQINDLMGAELGGGFQQFTNDLQLFDIENTTYTLYLQFPFTVADGVVLSPEVSYMDWGDVEIKGVGAAKADAGTNAYVGLYSKINF